MQAERDSLCIGSLHAPISSPPLPGKPPQHFPPCFSRVSPSPTCVSRGWLYDRVPRLQNPSLLSFLYHPQADAVLHTAPRIEVLTFCHWKQRNQAEFLKSTHMLNRLLIPQVSARATLLTCLPSSPPCFTTPETSVHSISTVMGHNNTARLVLDAGHRSEEPILCQSPQNMTSPFIFLLYYSPVIRIKSPGALPGQ